MALPAFRSPSDLVAHPLTSAPVAPTVEKHGNEAKDDQEDDDVLVMGFGCVEQVVQSEKIDIVEGHQNR